MPSIASLPLRGHYISLEPLEQKHLDGLVEASAADPSLYQWSPVPQGKDEAADYIATALRWHNAGHALPFAIIRASDGAVIGPPASGTLSSGLGLWDIPAMDANSLMPAKSVTPGLLVLPFAQQQTPRRSFLCSRTPLKYGVCSACACTLTGETTAPKRRFRESVASARAFFAHIAWRRISRRATRFATQSSRQNGPA